MFLLFFLLLNMYIALVVFSMWYYFLIVASMLFAFCFYSYDCLIIKKSHYILSEVLQLIRFEKVMVVVALRSCHLFFFFDAHELDLLWVISATMQSICTWYLLLYSFFVWW